MKPAEPDSSATVAVASPPANFLNAYSILDTGRLAWDVRTYLIERTDGKPQTHKDRGAVKQAAWAFKTKHNARCRSYGFLFEVDERTVVMPAGWDLPSGEVIDGYRITRGDTFTARGSDPAHRAIIAGVLREVLKKRFKDNPSKHLGPLWRDFGRHCQMPKPNGGRFNFCRNFEASAKLLRGGRWVVEIMVGTSTLDSRSLADYYRRGEVRELAEMILAKQVNRKTRDHGQTAVGVWIPGGSPAAPSAEVLDLEDPGIIVAHGTLSREDQMTRAAGNVRCLRYRSPSSEIALANARLVLDTQITGEDHAETIIAPAVRAGLMGHVRDLLDGADAYGCTVRLDSSPLSAEEFETLAIAPPAIRVRGDGGAEMVIPAPAGTSEEELRSRAKERSRNIHRNGFLEKRPINPLLACPTEFGERRATRMARDMNYLLGRHGVEQTFDFFLYGDAQAIRRRVEEGAYDALLAVLPEGIHVPPGPDDTHEQIKRLVEVPSQCIKMDNTLPATWVDRPHKEFTMKDGRRAARIKQRYELCVINLLVKHHWVPFAPVDAFFYNVHVGLDVGGKDNTTAMACLGHGFRNPAAGLVFLPQHIPLFGRQTEPIPPDALKAGLRGLFEQAHSEISAHGMAPDFERTIFYRDGRLLGRGDEWNEKEALTGLHRDFLDRGWITENSVWTAVEVMKDAEGWRLFNQGDWPGNPLVGLCVFPFDDADTALVCTTGRPYLTQGTAGPVKIQIHHIHGRATREVVIKDLVWQADMGFTKPDMGLSLPWVLHVADRGALQVSKSYKVSGVTA